MKADKIRGQITDLVKEFHAETKREKKAWARGDKMPYASRVYDENELVNLIDSSLDFWLTAGRYAIEFEKKLSEYLSVKYAYAVNSGSSANLLAFMSLTSPLLGDRAIKRGDEVITVAAAFPTTVAPILQYGAVPVFADVLFPSCNIDISLLDAACSEKTKAVMLAHSLGYPFDIASVKAFCDKNKLWLIEDNCDAIGAEALIDGKWKKTGTIGDIGTSSFYPAHHLTMGEGGAVYTNDKLLAKILLSMRDWGRDCVCPPGNDGICGKRFSGNFGELPAGYDHKYVYSHLGYNLKITDMQAAVGAAQLDKLSGFVEKRRKNFKRLYDGIAASTEKYLILPEEGENKRCSPFGFIVTIRDNAPFTRAGAVDFLEKRGIQTRVLFSGNLIKHPCFDSIRGTDAYRVSGGLSATDKILSDSFWVGVYPGLSDMQIDYIAEAFRDFFKVD